MGKLDHRRVEARELARLEHEFSTAVKAVVNEADIDTFLFHLLTESEQIMVVRRIRIAKMLLSGSSAEEIQNTLHAGISTIQNVERWMSSFPDYRKILPPVYREYQKAKQHAHHHEPFSYPPTFRMLRKKYPLHFLIFNLLLDE